MMVGFLDEVGSTGRAPPCNCRARLAATMMNRYVLCSGSSGRVQCALLRGFCLAHLFQIFYLLNFSESVQNGPDLVFDPVAPHPLGANDRGQSGPDSPDPD